VIAMGSRRAVRIVLTLEAIVGVALVGSGAFLTWFYRPTTALSYVDIKQLHTEVTAGVFVRNVHRIGQFVAVVLWAAICVVAIAELTARDWQRNRLSSRHEWAIVTATGVPLVYLALLNLDLSSTIGDLLSWYTTHLFAGATTAVLFMLCAMAAWSTPGASQETSSRVAVDTATPAEPMLVTERGR
jgi:hypothetical protein